MLEYVIYGLVLFNIVFVALIVREEIKKHRPKYRVIIHFLYGEPVIWYSNLPWEQLEKHLPPCMSRIGDDRVTAWQIEPP